MIGRAAFVLAVVLAQIFIYAEARTAMILLVAYAIVHTLAYYGRDATTKYYDERRRRILAGDRP